MSSVDQDRGVTPAGPGSQASPEAASASSPSVSIPNAETPPVASYWRDDQWLCGRGLARLTEAVGSIVSMCADSRDVFPDYETSFEAVTEAVNELYGCIEDGVFGPSVPDEWIFTGGEIPEVGPFEVVWALGRYGDVYGPLPFEMIDSEAWCGCMGGGAHDLIAYHPCAAEWRSIFPYRPRPARRGRPTPTPPPIQEPNDGEQ